MRRLRIPTFSTCAASALVALLVAGPGAAGPTSSITGNAIYRLAGNGDTLWMVTGNGLNFTIASTGTLRWWGYETDKVLSYQWYGGIHTPLAFGDTRALTCLLPPDNSSEANKLWVFDHRSGAFGSFSLAWNRGNLADSLPDSAKNDIYFDAYDAAWTPGYFWVACLQGGLVRIRAADAAPGGTVPATVFYPGVDTGYPLQDFPPQGFADYPDSNREVAGVTSWADSAGGPLLALRTPHRVWTFSPADAAWDTLANALADEAGNVDTRRSIRQFVRLFADSDTARRALYAAVDTTRADDTVGSALVRYDAGSRRWLPVGSGRTTALTFGNGDTAYAVVSGDLAAMQTGATLRRMAGLSDAIDARMVQADESVLRPSVNDVLCVPHAPDSSLLWIASNDGLYYSRAERQDEETGTAFTRASRAPKLAQGLRKTYFVPTILSPDAGPGYFAYNLEKKARVTITVYDWNMDFVKTVIKDRAREAGGSRPDGRSTVKKEDTWDGTDQNGKPVAPGVYYYKILSSERERAMGKIVVAR